MITFTCKHLAKKCVKTLGMVGAGVIGRTVLMAVKAGVGIQQMGIQDLIVAYRIYKTANEKKYLAEIDVMGTTPMGINFENLSKLNYEETRILFYR